MKFPEMERLMEWIGKGVIEKIDTKRKASGELRREGKFSTVRIIWLSLFVAHSGKSSLFEIMQNALSLQRSLKKLTESGFCKARARFSPQVV